MFLHWIASFFTGVGGGQSLVVEADKAQTEASNQRVPA